MRGSLFLSAALLLGFLTMIHTAGAATLHVPGDFAAIQPALDAATGGDTVLVAPGVYSGPDNIFLDYGGKGLSLLSESGPEVTVIDVGPAGIGLIFNDNEPATARLEGFTIRNGSTGVSCNGGSPTISDCVITGHEQDAMGAGIYLRSGATVVGCTITGNSSAKGGGIYIYSNSATVSGCIISGNTADHGGGVFIDRTRPTITDCVISGNTAGIDGGGIHAFDATHALIQGTVISGNIAVSGGGVYSYETDPITFTDCTVAGNHADEGGGFSSLIFSTPHVERCIIWGNCSDLPGDQLYTSPTSDIWLTCCDVDTAGIEGDVVFFGGQIFTDPLFCDPVSCEAAPTTDGDYTLQAGSLCLSESSPCGELIGALPEGCPAAHAPGAPFAPNRLFFAAHPNPSGGVVTLRITVPKEERLAARLHDVRGRLVETLFDQVLGAGQHSFSFDLESGAAGRLSAGTYYVRLVGEECRESQKILVLR